MADDLSDSPAAIVTTAEHDPLRDEGEAYAERLRDAGVAVTARCKAKPIHGFITMYLISPACAAAGDRISADFASGRPNAQPEATDESSRRTQRARVTSGSTKDGQRDHRPWPGRDFSFRSSKARSRSRDLVAGPAANQQFACVTGRFCFSSWRA